MSTSSNPRGLSLRKMLVLLLLIGLTIGFLGRWFFRSPELFWIGVYSITSFLSYLTAGFVLTHIGAWEKRNRITVLGSVVLVGPFAGQTVMALASSFTVSSTYDALFDSKMRLSLNGKV